MHDDDESPHEYPFERPLREDQQTLLTTKDIKDVVDGAIGDDPPIGAIMAGSGPTQGDIERSSVLAEAYARYRLGRQGPGNTGPSNPTTVVEAAKTFSAHYPVESEQYCNNIYRMVDIEINSLVARRTEEARARQS